MRRHDAQIMGVPQPESDLVVSCILVDAAGTVLDARDLDQRRSASGVILYARDTGRALLLEALDAGACGFVLTEAAPDDLLDAIGAVATGTRDASPTAPRDPTTRAGTAPGCSRPDP
jgi:DNA-binding NarL/FixJ family response regulator